MFVLAVWLFSRVIYKRWGNIVRAKDTSKEAECTLDFCLQWGHRDIPATYTERFLELNTPDFVARDMTVSGY